MNRVVQEPGKKPDKKPEKKLDKKKLDKKPEHKPENKPDKKPENKLDKKKLDKKPDKKSENKPDKKSENKPDKKPENKLDKKPEHKPDKKPENKPDKKPENKLDKNPEHKPDKKPENKLDKKKLDKKPDKKPENKLDKNPEHKPENKAERKKIGSGFIDVKSPIGKGEKGAVYRYYPGGSNDPFRTGAYVVKMFSKKEHYEEEKRNHQMVLNHTKGNPELQKLLCLACKYFDDANAILLPYLDPSNGLEGRFSSGKQFGLKDCYEIVEKLMKILKELHKCDIIHGDFKAKNIILTENGPILFDFGESKDIQKEIAKVEKDKRRGVKDQLIDIDCRQLLWIICQLRFNLPFVRVMIDLGKGKPEADRWDPHPLIYYLAGLRFDDLSDLVANSGEFWTIETIQQVQKELFNPAEINLLVGPHNKEEIELITKAYATIDKKYKTLKQKADPDIRKKLSRVFLILKIRFRMLLSVNSKDLEKKCQDEENHFIKGLENLENEMHSFLHRLKNFFHYEFQWFPIYGPLLKVMGQGLACDLEGMSQSLGLLYEHTTVFADLIQVMRNESTTYNIYTGKPLI